MLCEDLKEWDGGGLQQGGCIYIYIYTHTHIYIYIYIYREREREREKEMATHSSFLAWRIPGTGEPGGLPSVGSHRVGHD